MSISGRGGKRSGGGRPSSWRNSPTSTIRVPTIFSESLLEIAHKLDQGLKETLVINPETLKAHSQSKVEKIPISALRIYKQSGKKVFRLEDLYSILGEILE